MEQAHIIFSPYNYLIDPRVRQSMKIPVNDNVIILDEAHNIEDSARESAGGTFSQDEFRMALNDCEKVRFGLRLIQSLVDLWLISCPPVS